ncbi:uncharacterized protein MELLADRAFT_123649 [Melampsora larici-populina 98AG31]|uniref:Secreted protein n=1 Tax=Melampsora larici-populina (strain 98AG31 / pathotype 3-4-7) TaxID=747676 RepID=F4RJS3_MELLP|nr:uncharacterized protein MELLADRAFT_123649 [Melampsora larici-populina 98AG31]EGG07445.1 secreted protein [Melampsora larici-populina 98AG31]
MRFCYLRVVSLLLFLLTLTYQKDIPCNSVWAPNINPGQAICKCIGQPKRRCKMDSCKPIVSQVSCPDGTTHNCDGTPTAHEYINNTLVCRGQGNQFFRNCWLTATPVCASTGCSVI